MDLATTPLPIFQRRAVPFGLLWQQPVALLPHPRLPSPLNDLHPLRPRRPIPIPPVHLLPLPQSPPPTQHNLLSRPHRPLPNRPQRSPLHLPPSPTTEHPRGIPLHSLLPPNHHPLPTNHLRNPHSSPSPPRRPCHLNPRAQPLHHHRPSSRPLVGPHLPPQRVLDPLPLPTTIHIIPPARSQPHDRRFPHAMPQHPLAEPPRLPRHQSLGARVRTADQPRRRGKSELRGRSRQVLRRSHRVSTKGNGATPTTTAEITVRVRTQPGWTATRGGDVRCGESRNRRKEWDGR